MESHPWLILKPKKIIMKWNFLFPLVAVFFITFILYSCRKDQLPCNCNPENISANVSVFATGLNNPRGLKFGPDGYLYVAEGGIGGTGTTTGCEQVVPPVGPYTGSKPGHVYQGSIKQAHAVLL
jgi:hypothetical protein